MQVNTTKGLDIVYVLLIYLVDVLELFLLKTEKEKVLLKDLTRYSMILIENQIKYG